MNFIGKLISITLACTCIACNYSQQKEDESWEQKLQAKELAKQARLKQYADSTVALSFKGIILGQPFILTTQEAKKKGSIYALTAIGYSLIYSILQLINMSNAAVFLTSAVIFYALYTSLTGS
ncbi:MAG: hypothetical protein SO127_03935, partial [Muribaculaceae bacterium]|nr:hypothetical protein [Muribaculaceae bacterium]